MLGKGRPMPLDAIRIAPKPSVFEGRVIWIAVAVGLMLAGCAKAPKPPPAPPPPAVQPLVNLSPRVVEMASAYRAYVVRASAIDPAFVDGDGVGGALRASSAYEPDQMVRGAIAYAAVVALQDKAFVDGVRAYARDPGQRREVVAELLKNPAYAQGLNGSASAAGLIIANLGGDAQRLYDVGKAVKQSAYDIQRADWSKASVADREGRLAAAKAASQAAMLGEVAESARLQQASLARPSAAVSVVPVEGPYTVTVNRGLTIAALAVLGEAGDAQIEPLMDVMREARIGGCLNSAKLNLYQCLAVARPHYEDVFCLGQHAMMDTGRCMIRSAGLAEPYEARFIPDASSINKGMGKKLPTRKPVRKKS